MSRPPAARSRHPLLAALAVLALGALPAQAAPAAYVERAFSASLGYAFLGPVPGLLVGAGVELPVGVPLPVDFSVGLEAFYRGEVGGRLLLKALLLPSLLGDPPLALAVGLDTTLAVSSGGPVGVRVGFGPIVSLDYSPAVLSFSAFPSFGGGGFGLDLGLGARYYLDPFALELGLDFSTLGRAAVALGFRYLF